MSSGLHSANRTVRGIPKLDQLRELNELILGFAEVDEEFSQRTRSYSTPFRGKLFGFSTQNEVAQVLEERCAEVLILGSNPNNSADRNGIARFRSLEDQIASQSYSEVVWDAAGNCSPGWCPIKHGHAGWRLLTQSVAAAEYDLDCMTMANVFPWGASDMLELREGLGEGLFKIAQEFSNELFWRLVILLRPRLVVVPFSLTTAAPLTWLSLRRAEARTESVTFQRGTTRSTTRLQVGRTDVAGHPMTIVHVPHPSWMIRLSSQAKKEVGLAITNVCRVRPQ